MNKYILRSIFILYITGTSLLYAPTGWMNPVNAAPQGTFQWLHNCIVTDNSGRIFVAVREKSLSECNDLTVHRSLDAGQNWTWLTHPNSGGTGSIYHRSTDITTSGDTLMVAFEKQGNPLSRNRIHFMISSDSGENWTDDVVISSGNNRMARHPRIAVGSGYLYSIWADTATHYDTFEIHFSYSTNWGASWSTDQRVTTAVRNSWHPAMSVNAGAIHVVWADNRLAASNYEVYYNKSTNHGSSWDSDQKLSADLDVSEFPDIVAYTDPNDTCVHVVWQDDRSDSAGIWYIRSTNNGLNWGNDTLLFADGHHPAIAADSLGLYVVCEKSSNIWYLESTDWGTNWTTTQITNTSNYDSFPDVFADASITTEDLIRNVIFKRTPTSGGNYICFTKYDTIPPDTVDNLRKEPLYVPPPVKIRWDGNNTERDLRFYRVYKRVLPWPFWAMIDTTKDTTYTDNDVQGGKTYAYYVTACDANLNESPPSNIIEVYVPDPGKRINLGARDASPYTIKRSGYYQWGKSSDSTADFGNHLKYRLTNFVPEYDYAIGFVLFEPTSDSGRVLSISSNSYCFEEEIAVPESIQCVCYSIPTKLYEQGNLELTIPGIGGEAVLSQIFIWENSKGGGPQSSRNADMESGLNLQIYPSLGRGAVTIYYELPFDTEATVEVYDCVGRTIYRKEQLQNPGLQKIELDSAEIPTGVYFVRLKTAARKETRKVIFLK